MTRATLDPTTRQALAELDPAPPAALTAEQQARADRTLAGILTHERRGAQPSDTDLLPRPVRHWVAITATLAVVAVLVAIAFLVGLARNAGDPRGAEVPAAPSSTPSLTSEQLAMGQECRDLSTSLLDGGRRASAEVTTGELRAAQILIAEQRGNSRLVLLGDEAGLDVGCVDNMPPTTRFGAGWVRRQNIRPEDLAPSEIRLTGAALGAEEDMMSVISGYVGSDVTAVTIHTASGDVEATMARGHLAAWWAGAEARFRPRSPTVLDVALTLRDGTTADRSVTLDKALGLGGSAR